jgi:glycine/D-amino acid oxidase-like deaminating enzyme
MPKISNKERGKMESQPFSEKSYWLSTRDYAPGQPLSADIDVDVAIVGGGFTGLSTAYHLKKKEPGLRIAILESEVIGFGASGRNGGFNMTLFGLTLGITALRFGKRKAREAHLYMEKAVDLLRDLVAELDLDCDYEHPGFLRVATSEKYRRAFWKRSNWPTSWAWAASSGWTRRNWNGKSAAPCILEPGGNRAAAS